MQGGFGAQAFGHSTASTAAVKNAVAAGMSGGVRAPTASPAAMQGGFGAQAFGKSTASSQAVGAALARGLSGGVAPRPTAMQGGFGAQAFGKSTASTNAVSAALARGLSGGVPDKKNGFTTHSGWQVGPTGPVSPTGTNTTTVNKTLDLSPTKYQDRISPEEQMRSQAYNRNVIDLANQYRQYRTPPAGVQTSLSLPQQIQPGAGPDNFRAPPSGNVTHYPAVNHYPSVTQHPTTVPEAIVGMGGGQGLPAYDGRTVAAPIAPAPASPTNGTLPTSPHLFPTDPVRNVDGTPNLFAPATTGQVNLPTAVQPSGSALPTRNLSMGTGVDWGSEMKSNNLFNTIYPQGQTPFNVNPQGPGDPRTGIDVNPLALLLRAFR